MGLLQKYILLLLKNGKSAVWRSNFVFLMDLVVVLYCRILEILPLLHPEWVWFPHIKMIKKNLLFNVCICIFNAIF